MKNIDFFPTFDSDAHKDRKTLLKFDAQGFVHPEKNPETFFPNQETRDLYNSLKQDLDSGDMDSAEEKRGQLVRMMNDAGMRIGPAFLQRFIQQRLSIQAQTKDLKTDIENAQKTVTATENEDEQDVFGIQEAQNKHSSSSLYDIPFEEPKDSFEDIDDMYNTKKPEQNYEEISFENSDIQIFVNQDNRLDKNDVPKDLVSIQNTPYLVTSKPEQLRAEAKEQLERMSKDFYKNFGVPMTVVSAYRSYDYQSQIARNDPQCVINGKCAKPGESEHQTGLAIDIFAADSNFSKNPTFMKYYQWMVDNAHKYGYSQSYQKGRAIDGYDKEEWHWRYLGNNLASTLKANNITFAQYVKENNIGNLV